MNRTIPAVRHLSGKVSRISPLNMAFVSDASSDKSYVFPYRVIRGYKGESPRELGLKPGRPVRLSIGPNDQVIEAVLA